MHGKRSFIGDCGPEVLVFWLGVGAGVSYTRLPFAVVLLLAVAAMVIIGMRGASRG